MKRGAALHSEPLRLKAAETCELDVRAAQVKAKGPLGQIKGGRTGELRPVVGQDDIGELGFIAGRTHVSAKSREWFVVNSQSGSVELAHNAQALQGPDQAHIGIHHAGNRIIQTEHRHEFYKSDGTNIRIDGDRAYVFIQSA